MDILPSREAQDGLNTTQLEEKMKPLLRSAAELGNQFSHVDFLGVFPFDLFPLESFLDSSAPSCSKAICCIVNSDPSDKPGTHWVAFFMNKSQQIEDNRPILEFFDSYGLPPSTYSFDHISSAFNVLSNKYSLQSYSSTVCGHYCLFYLYLRSLVFHSTIASSLSVLEAHNNVIEAIHRLGASPLQRDKNLKLILSTLMSTSTVYLAPPHSLPPSTYTSLISNSLHKSCTIQNCTPFLSNDFA